MVGHNLTPIDKEYQNRRKKLAYLTERIEKGQKVSQASLRWIEMLATSKLLTDFDIVDTIERIEDEIKKIKRPDERVKYLIALAKLKMERRKLSFELQETVEQKLSLESINDYLQKSKERVQSGMSEPNPQLQDRMASLERKFLTPVDSAPSGGVIRAQPSSLEVFELSDDSPFKNIKRRIKVTRVDDEKPEIPLPPLGTITDVPDLSHSKIPEELLYDDPVVIARNQKATITSHSDSQSSALHANIDDVTETTSVGTDNSDSQRTENIDTNFDGISNLALSDTTLDVSEITRSYVPEDEPSEPFIEKIAEDIDADDTFNEEAYEQTDLAAGMNLPPDDGWSISYPPSKSNSYITTVNINGNSDDEEDKPKQDSDSIYVGFER